MTTAPWEPPIAGTEVQHLVAALERQRATFRWKADGLDADGLAHTVGRSTISLGGLLKHLALVEDHYFTVRVAGDELPEVWADADDSDDSDDWEFRTAGSDDPATLYTVYDDAVARSRRVLSSALFDGDLDQLLDLGEGRPRPSLRRTLCDLLEEYARHTGHADLIREDLDGRVGEDPPADWRPDPESE